MAFKRISKFPVANGYTPDSGAFFRQLPDAIIIDFVQRMPAADESTMLLAEDVYLIHPMLGDPRHNRVARLHMNQFEWMAREWKKICKEQVKGSGGATTPTPLFISGDKRYVIETDGSSYHLEKYAF